MINISLNSEIYSAFFESCKESINGGIFSNNIFATYRESTLTRVGGRTLHEQAAGPRKQFL